MTRRRSRINQQRWMAIGALVALGLLASAHVAQADAPVAQGWWWAANASAPVALPAAPVPPPALAPPDVPADALHVAADASGPEAISALFYVVGEGSRASTLSLKVTGTTLGTPAIRLCPTQSAWTPAQSGPWGTRPQYNCATDAPLGTLAADGTSMAWSVASFADAPAIDLVLVPAADGPQPPFRITFEKPSATSLAVNAGASEDAFSLSGSETFETASPFYSVDVVAASNSGSFGGDFGSFTPAPQATSAGAAPRTDLYNPAPRTGGLVANSTPAGTARDMVQTVGMFGLIILAAIYSRFSGQEQREPRSLVNFAKNREPAPSVGSSGGPA